jgi:NADPH-dependent 7-cyano-7-deazaguanine reductase QueF
MTLEGKEITIDRIGRLVLGDRFDQAYKEDFCHIDVRYIPSSKLVNDIYEKMHKQNNGDISRLLLSDLRTLFEYHEKEANEIIAYLIDLFSKHGVTFVFAYTSSNVEDILNSELIASKH